MRCTEQLRRPVSSLGATDRSTEERRRVEHVERGRGCDVDTVFLHPVGGFNLNIFSTIAKMDDF